MRVEDKMGADIDEDLPVRTRKPIARRLLPYQRFIYLLAYLAGLTMPVPPIADSQAYSPTDSQPASSRNALSDDQPVSLRFYGSNTADLFTRELQESFQGVLEKNFVAKAGNGFPAGFANASLPGFPWAGTMWTRDGGTFMRELAMRGYYAHAMLLANCLMDLVDKNPQGFYSFPEYFKGSQRGSGSEVDGTTSIIIGMVMLWEHLPDENPAKARIRSFLFQHDSPVNYLKFLLADRPLVAGSGEFGCGVGIPGECFNVVQNNMTMLALLAAARMAEESGSAAEAEEYRRLAAKVRNGMEKYLVDEDGAWVWCVDSKTMRADAAVLASAANKGFGGVNGVLTMDADVLGFLPSEPSWEGIGHSEKTFQRLYDTPMRKQEFDRYGIWTQFDIRGGGVLSSPSYGQGYAIQAMLLSDKLAMADKALSWLANATHDPIPEYKLHRDSRYFFYERTYSPDAVGKIQLEEGCGALNLVNVSEPLKVSRLLLGVDDTAKESVRIIPRIPPSWKGMEAANWPIKTRRGIVRAGIHYETRGAGAELTLKLAPGGIIDDLRVRMPSAKGYVWLEQKGAASAHLVTK